MGLLIYTPLFFILSLVVYTTIINIDDSDTVFAQTSPNTLRHHFISNLTQAVKVGELNESVTNWIRNNYFEPKIFDDDTIISTMPSMGPITLQVMVPPSKSDSIGEYNNMFSERYPFITFKVYVNHGDIPTKSTGLKVPIPSLNWDITYGDLREPFANWVRDNYSTPVRFSDDVTISSMPSEGPLSLLITVRPSNSHLIEEYGRELGHSAQYLTFYFKVDHDLPGGKGEFTTVDSGKLQTFDGILVYNKYVKSFEYPNPYEWYYDMNFTEINVDIVVVKIPNTYPLYENISFGNSWILDDGCEYIPSSSLREVQVQVPNWILNDGCEDPAFDPMVEFYGECYRTHVIKPYFQYDYLETFGGSVAAGIWEPTAYPVEEFCNDIYENPPAFKECKDGSDIHINKRGEAVCVFSVTELFDRGYLI